MRATRTSGERVAPRLSLLTTALALSASALLSAGPAHAAEDQLPEIPDYQSALDAVRSTAVRDAVCRFLGTPLPAGGSEAPLTIPDKARPCEGMPAFTVEDPLAVNEITPGFVAGTAKPVAAEAVGLSHLVASLSAAVDGRQATVLLSRTEGGGWRLAAVREGDSDAAYAGKAGPGSLVFSEPQIRGWYRLTLLTVEPLNDQARQGLGGRASLSLGEYQKLVKGRYADKLPGSEYDAAGMSSGYGAPQEASSPAPLLAGGSGAVLALAVVALLVHRRRRGATG